MGQGQYEAGVSPLENSLVLRKIFSNLNTKELLGVSFVNKFWNYEARCILRDQKKCMAVIKGKKPCSRAKELNGMLGSLAVIPFNGLHINITEYHDCDRELCHRKIEEIYGNLLEMPLKYLTFMWNKHEKCVLGQMLLILMRRSLTLEHLHIQDIPRKVTLERRNRDKKELSLLPNLKTLELRHGKHLTDSLIEPVQFGGRAAYRTYGQETSFWSNWLNVLANRAPNLEELKNMIDLYDIEDVPSKYLQIFKNVKLPRFWPEDEDILKRMNKFCNEGPKIHTLSAEFPRVPTGRLKMDLYWTLLFDILCRSSGSLQEVVLDSRSAFMFRKFAPKMQPLANVTSLGFEMNVREGAAISRFLTPVPLGKIFPSISAVTIDWYHYRYSSTVGDEEAEFRCPAVYPWPAVTKVTLHYYELRDQSFRDLATLFPNLRSLVLPDFQNYDWGHSFRQIWSGLPGLEKLATSITTKISLFRGVNFDAEFCGIHEAEAAILRKKDDTYLKTVNIVPPFRPIHYLKDLKSVTICITCDRSCTYTPAGASAKTLFLSRVTGLIALRQMPTLVFNVHAYRMIQYLEHLRPYLNLIRGRVVQIW